MRKRIAVGCATSQGSELRTETITKYIVSFVGGILSPFFVDARNGGINRIADCLREGDLRHKQRFPRCVVDVHVYVWCSPTVPTREDTLVRHQTVGVGCLSTPQKVYAGQVGSLHTRTAVFGVVAVSVAVPDVHDSSLQSRTTGIFVFDGNLGQHRNALAVRADVV